jgi:hypothetical protein
MLTNITEFKNILQYNRDHFEDYDEYEIPTKDISGSLNKYNLRDFRKWDSSRERKL